MHLLKCEMTEESVGWLPNLNFVPIMIIPHVRRCSSHVLREYEP